MDRPEQEMSGGEGEFPVIRPVAAGDGTAVKPLLDQLGYALDAEEIERRIGLIARAAEQCLLVAEDESGKPVALLHVYGRAALEKPPEAVVQALVVRDGLRGQGLGRRMMALAEEWAAAQGYRHVSLSSRTGRDGAHAFYQGLGYRRYATAHHFRKTLEG